MALDPAIRGKVAAKLLRRLDAKLGVAVGSGLPLVMAQWVKRRETGGVGRWQPVFLQFV
jgi:hypothetical protein